MSLGHRKSLHVVRAGKERFLIATYIERSCFLTKLEQETIQKESNYITDEIQPLYDCHSEFISESHEMLKQVQHDTRNLKQEFLKKKSNSSEKTGMMRGILEKLYEM